jgi:NTE family protein
MKTITALVTLLLGLSVQAQYPFKNLVLEGGGIRGMAYCGALTVLEKKGVLQQIEKVGGTSAGSIAGLLLSLGYTASEIDSTMRNVHIEQFNDGNGGLLGKYKRAKRYYGIYKGDVFETWLEEMVERQTGNPLTNFAQLDSLAATNKRFKSFQCVGTNLSKQQLQVFSSALSPQMPLKTAVRISCSIPFFYEPVLLDSNFAEVYNPTKGQRYDVYVDGGIMANYPINLFDTCVGGGHPLTCDSVRHNYQTLGLKLERDEQIRQLDRTTAIPPYDIASLNDYFGAFMNLVMETMNRKPKLENERGRTIYIGYGSVASKPRKMSRQEKEMLYQKGVKAAETFFKTNNGYASQ